ncbi:MAG TPA: histidine phosphatase family protein [bacterium]|nr:histidine phosphatase family protein [bacterium]
MKIYFVTHATTSDNEQGIASGHRDAQLSSAGRARAAALAETLRHLPFDVVCCSPLSRSRETATIAFNGRSPILVDGRLSEVDYGRYNGAPTRQVDGLRASHIVVPFPSGESYERRVALVRAFLDEFGRGHPDRTPLIIGHRATLYALQTLSGHGALREVVAEPFEWQPYWEFDISVDPKQPPRRGDGTVA